MSKKLVIKFWKPACSLVAQIAEQCGFSEEKEDGIVHISNHFSMRDESRFLSEPRSFYQHVNRLGIILTKDAYSHPGNIISLTFKCAAFRDQYLSQITTAITNELFTSSNTPLEIGKKCVAWCNDVLYAEKRTLLAILPENMEFRYICDVPFMSRSHQCFKFATSLTEYVKPEIKELSTTELTYTWEEK